MSDISMIVREGKPKGHTWEIHGSSLKKLKTELQYDQESHPTESKCGL